MKNKFEKYLKSEKPVLLAFVHAARQDAVKVKYELEDLKEKYGDKAEFVMVDSSYNPDLVNTYSIDTYPSWVIFKDGKEVWRDKGDKEVESIDQAIAGYMN